MREIRSDDTRDKNQEHVLKHQEWKCKSDWKNWRNHAPEITDKKREMARQKSWKKEICLNDDVGTRRRDRE